MTISDWLVYELWQDVEGGVPARRLALLQTPNVVHRHTGAVLTRVVSINFLVKYGLLSLFAFLQGCRRS